ncbi:hypothetical protein Tco_0656398 [Tanacetum coccineum]|uniref:Uncharacterized protein n=1 Tax=Tanacetum coccineum TaxID=301880 RepID=A0ABQ4X8N1_9ASTR
MFESGTYKSLSEHVALYESLKASMERANRDEFFAKKYKSRKRRRDDQDPPPSLPDSNLSKKKRHDYDASGSQQPPAPPSSAWETSDTREAPSSSSKQKSVPHSEQPVKDVPIPDDVNISDSEDTDTAQLPKIKTRLDWLKPANALASSYQDPDEYKLLRQTGGMSSFINWFCKRIEKKKLSKSDLEGPAFKVVRPFHYNNISLQFQMEECHLLLTDQVDLVDRVVPDVSKPLPLGGPPGQETLLSETGGRTCNLALRALFQTKLQIIALKFSSELGSSDGTLNMDSVKSGLMLDDVRGVIDFKEVVIGSIERRDVRLIEGDILSGEVLEVEFAFVFSGRG